VIEDSDLGVRAAKAAAMRCIAVSTTLPAARLAHADLVLPSLEDIAAVLAFVRGGEGASKEP
jgi:beta-phosphoglucomutase-like phosphatase (HAD superfamily)